MSDPKKIVKDYLSKNGFPFEMYVAKQFKQAGFEIYQSTIYRDSETGKDREIDIVAYYVRNFKDIQFSFRVVIECKYAQTPWVLFTGENIGFSDLPIDTFYCSNIAGKKLLETLSRSPAFGQSNPFKIEPRMAYGMTETSNSTNSTKDQKELRNSYKAVATLLSLLRYERDIDKTVKGKVFEIFIPVVAIQGKLFECYLDESNDEIINEISEGQLIYKSNIYPSIFPMIEIITKDKVPELAEKLYYDLNRIYHDHYSEIGYLLDNYPSADDVSVW